MTSPPCVQVLFICTATRLATLLTLYDLNLPTDILLSMHFLDTYLYSLGQEIDRGPQYWRNFIFQGQRNDKQRNEAKGIGFVPSMYQ